MAWGGRGRGGARVSDYFTKNLNNCLFLGGGL